MNSRAIRLGLLGLGVLTLPVLAHHSFAAEFDANKPVLLTGRISRVEWLNPHARIYLDVNASPGSVVSWELQLGSPNGLVRQGWSRDLLKSGDALTVSGYLARDGSRLASARTLRLRGGRLIQLGPLGDGGPAKLGDHGH